MSDHHPMRPARCRATNRRGATCGNPAIVGGVVCRMHGGAAPHVQDAARQRIAALALPALDTLRRALDADDLGAAVRAARDLLDRAGYGAPKQVEVSGPAGTPVTGIAIHVVEPDQSFTRWLTGEQLRQIAAWKAEALARRDAGEPPFSPFDSGTFNPRGLTPGEW